MTKDTSPDLTAVERDTNNVVPYGSGNFPGAPLSSSLEAAGDHFPITACIDEDFLTHGLKSCMHIGQARSVLACVAHYSDREIQRACISIMNSDNTGLDERAEAAGLLARILFGPIDPEVTKALGGLDRTYPIFQIDLDEVRHV